MDATKARLRASDASLISRIPRRAAATAARFRRPRCVPGWKRGRFRPALHFARAGAGRDLDRAGRRDRRHLPVAAQPLQPLDQTCVTALMACGMVFIIVARQIDLSVGSLDGLHRHGDRLDAGHGWARTPAPPGSRSAAACWPARWSACSRAGGRPTAGAGLRRHAGRLPDVARRGLPRRRRLPTLAPLALPYQRLGGGVNGSIGTAWSWALGAFACALVIAAVLRARCCSRPPLCRHGAGLGRCAQGRRVLRGDPRLRRGGQRLPDPRRPPRRHAAGQGIGIPVLILIAAAALLHGVATSPASAATCSPTAATRRRRCSRPADAPRAAAAVRADGRTGRLASVITTARLNSGTHSIGQMAELYVIAATVIGGTSLAGGAGTIPARSSARCSSRAWTTAWC